jgi:hypothetical protein
MTNSPKVQATDWQVLFRIGIISSILLGAFFIGSTWVEKWILQFTARYADEVRIGLMLFLLWLVVASSVRSADKVRSSMEGWKLIALGTAIAMVGAVIYNLFRIIFPAVIWSAETAPTKGFMWQSLLFFTAVGFVLSLVTVIRERVNNKLWANMLILLIIVGIGFLIFRFAR